MNKNYEKTINARVGEGSPVKLGAVGRWISGRKKHVDDDGTTVITDKRGGIVRTKTADGTKTKYKKGNRPQRRANSRSIGDNFTGGTHGGFGF